MLYFSLRWGADVRSRIETVFRDPSAVAVGPRTGLPGAEFTLLSGRSATGWAATESAFFGVSSFFN
jgi:hypothetical protein